MNLSLTKSKINQRATLLLLEAVENLRSVPIATLVDGESQQQKGAFTVISTVYPHTPYFGTKQLHCAVEMDSQRIVETIFYRSEE